MGQRFGHSSGCARFGARMSSDAGAPEFVENPELVKQRLMRYAGVVGKENVIGGTDCGLSRGLRPARR